MKIRNSTELVMLGALMRGPKHGYEVMQFLSSALEPAWRVSTSQLYVLLKRLELEGMVQSTLESQESRPSKRVFRITNKGKKVFLEWLKSPVEHVRDFRTEFLTKLFFFYHLTLPGLETLVDAQVRALKELKGTVQERERKEKDVFMKLVYGYKIHTIDSLVTWLCRKARSLPKEEIDGPNPDVTKSHKKKYS
jgi:PadR family transcriptional regulator AphA